MRETYSMSDQYWTLCREGGGIRAKEIDGKLTLFIFTSEDKADEHLQAIQEQTSRRLYLHGPYTKDGLCDGVRKRRGFEQVIVDHPGNNDDLVAQTFDDFCQP
jgi:hypothetical protein